MKKYALVQEGKIVKFRDVDESDAVLMPKLIAHHYLPVVADAKPTIDHLSETLSDDYVILDTKVEHNWIVTPLPPEEAAARKAEKAKQDKRAAIDKILDQIEQVWDDEDWEDKVIAIITKKHLDDPSFKEGYFIPPGKE